ncbi:MAG: hypothetical protein JW941_01755 [Candidatus Coatesbacteria bacterium]|nr:hypothetical protein [Candidatus Coatesbacteria bacterium]
MTEDKIPRLDKSAFSVVSLEDADNDLEYWLGKTPEERLSAVEINRWLVYGYDRATARLQRVFEVAELERD